jgi:molybdate transport system substrate-binding protein
VYRPRINKAMTMCLPVLLALFIFGCTPVPATITTRETSTQTIVSALPVTQTVTSTLTTTTVPVTLNVSAAVSLTDALKEINAVYIQLKPYITITPNFASSGTLQVQIENGAPCDVFISAAATQMDNLQKEGLLADNSRRDLLMNKVVLVAPGDSTLGLSSFSDLALEKVKKIAIGDPKSVPAGTYAQQAFDLLGITAQVQPKYVMGADVRAVLSYVESGNVDAGIVYSTDALTSSKVKVVASAPEAINAKIVYPAAALKAGKNIEAAKSYIDFLAGPQAKTIFEKYGFSMAK